MNISDILPYRITWEESEQYLKDLTENLLSGIKNVIKTEQNFVELSDGKRYAIKTFTWEPVYDLKNLKIEGRNFINKLKAYLDPNLDLYLENGVSIHYVYSSHRDPCTFDWIEKPNQAYWVFYVRFRQPGNDIPTFLEKDL